MRYRARLVGALLIYLVAITGCAAPANPATPLPVPTDELVTPAATTVVPPATPPAALVTELPPSPTVPAPAATAAVPVYTYQVVDSYPHDPNAFTQGLVYVDGVLFEGTGRYGQSSLREVDLETGQVQRQIELPEQFFGEGITLLDDRIFQLTWQSQQGFVYDAETFQQLATFTYPTEGWGLTHDGTRLLMSDGTSTLYFLDPQSLQETGRVSVRYGNQPVLRLNELEYIDGEVYANIWQTNTIVRIDPQTGQVVGVIDLTGLLSPADITQPIDVLNGIAYDAANDRLFVTGKLWPKLFEIDLLPAGQ
jgi:glutamine cyclotransferase